MARNPVRHFEILVAGLALGLFTAPVMVGVFRMLGLLPRYFVACISIGIAIGPGLIYGLRLWLLRKRLERGSRPWSDLAITAIWAVTFTTCAYLFLLGGLTMLKGLDFKIDFQTLAWNALGIGLGSALMGFAGGRESESN